MGRKRRPTGAIGGRSVRLVRTISGLSQALFLALAFSTGAQEAWARETRILTHASQVSQLTVDEAKREYPVVLRGVVTYAVVKLGLVFIYDRTGGAFVYFAYTPAVPQLHTGQMVEVHGITTPGDFSPCLKNGSFKVLGEAALPVPKRRGFDQLVTGKWVCDWVEVEGTVRSGKAMAGSIQLSLAVEGGKILVIMQEFPNWEHMLVGARVKMRGAVSVLYNDRRQSRGVKLFVPGERYVTIEKPAPADPYSLPLSSLSSLGQFDVTSDLDSQMRVNGSVTAVDGARIYLTNGVANAPMEWPTPPWKRRRIVHRGREKIST